MKAIIILMLVSCTFASVRFAPQQGEIRGRVCDLFGQAISNATISLTLENREPINETTTNSLGEFKLIVPKSGEYVVVVSKQGFQQQRKPIQVDRGEIIEANFGLEVGALHDPFQTELTGAVTATDGSQLQGVSVTIQSVFNPQLKVTTVTDSKGAYELSVNNPGQYLLISTGPNFVAEVIVVTIIPS